jgi:hypothetical protein
VGDDVPALLGADGGRHSRDVVGEVAPRQGDRKKSGVLTVMPQEREAIRRLGAEDGHRSRAAAGLPVRIEDIATAQTLSGRLQGAGTADTATVALSGRCGDCGYMLDAPGHEVSCGTMTG